MGTVVKTEVRIKHIEVTEDTIAAHLTDGCTISVPVSGHYELPAPEGLTTVAISRPSVCWAKRCW
jgi:hypothetical protein